MPMQDDHSLMFPGVASAQPDSQREHNVSDTTYTERTNFVCKQTRRLATGSTS